MVLARLRTGGGGGGRRGRDDDDDEEGDDDEDGWGASRRVPKKWYETVVEPVDAGVRLERSGDFGPVRPRPFVKASTLHGKY